LYLRLVVPHAVEGKRVGEAEGGAVAVEQQQSGTERARIRVADPDKTDGVSGLTEPESAERPEL